MENIKFIIELDGVSWQSDWNGYEIGFDSLPVVSLFSGTTKEGFACGFYTDGISGALLEFWLEQDEFEVEDEVYVDHIESR